MSLPAPEEKICVQVSSWRKLTASWPNAIVTVAVEYAPAHILGMILAQPHIAIENRIWIVVVPNTDFLSKMLFPQVQIALDANVYSKNPV